MFCRLRNPEDSRDKQSIYHEKNEEYETEGI
jgi:hypothetical protein